MNFKSQHQLVYDKQCPLCDTYCTLVRLEPAAGQLGLVNARERSDVMDEITAAGLDIDQGMVLKSDGRIYYGAEAIHALSLISSRGSLFNVLNYYTFRLPFVAKMLYPLLRAARNLLLKVMRRTKVNNLQIPGNDWF